MTTFYWYPKCTTCKKAKLWLEENQIKYKEIDMIESPPTAEELSSWMEKSDLPVRRFFNTSGIRYREQGLKDTVNDLSIKQAAEMLAKDGMLIKRPLLVVDGKAEGVGFKENVYEEVLLG